MLNKMRAGAKSTVMKFMLFGLLLMAMAGLALMDVQGMFSQGVSNTTIASFSHNKISAVEFDRLVQTALRAQGIKQADAYRAGVPRQLLQQEIDGRIITMAANDMGLRVNEALVAQQAKSMIAPLVEKGMSEKEALQRLLQAYDMSEPQLSAMLKSQIATQQLLSVLIMGQQAPQQMVDAMLKHRYEARKGDYFTLSAQDAGAVETPTDANLKLYYDSIARDYDLPEYRTLSVVTLDKKSVAGEVTLAPDRLKAYYDENIADYKTAEKRVISQAVAQDEETARKIFAMAEKTKNLQQAVDKMPKDKAVLIRSNEVTQESVTVELAKTAFEGAAGTVLPPVQSPLGWHILHIEKVTPSFTKPFDSVKAGIEKELAQDKVSEALYDRANKIDDEVAGGKTLSEVAKEYNLVETTIEKIDAQGIGADGKKTAVNVPLLDRVIKEGFSLPKDGTSPLIETPDGTFMIVGVKNLIPSEHQPFEKVRADVEKRWTADRQTKKLGEIAGEISERAKQGESLEKIAASFKKTPAATTIVKRDDTPAKSGLDKNLLNALFSLDKEGQVTAIPGNHNITIIRLTERRLPALNTIGKEDLESARTAMNRSLQQDLLDQYRAALIARYDVRLNDKLLNEMYAPKDDAADPAE